MFDAFLISSCSMARPSSVLLSEGLKLDEPVLLCKSVLSTDFVLPCPDAVLDLECGTLNVTRLVFER